MPRNRKPGTIRRLEGNRRKTEIPNEAIGVGVPVCNPDLGQDEQKFWWAVVDSLPAGLLTRADEQGLERMAIAWARMWSCTLKIREIGMMVRGPNGTPVRNPLLIVERQAREEMHRAGEVLGLSPVARARITAPDKVGEDPTEQLLGGIEDGAWSNVIPLQPTGNGRRKG